jgi:hypothetical protein
MLSSKTRVLLLGLTLLILGGILIFLGIEWQRARLRDLGIGTLVVSLGCFLLGALRGRRGPDPLERRREQRLWRSGPLGRKWLEGRRRIP